MLKRFLIGFALGMAATHWYLNNSGPVMAQVNAWFHRSGAKYSGEKTHRAADALLDRPYRH